MAWIEAGGLAVSTSRSRSPDRPYTTEAHRVSATGWATMPGPPFVKPSKAATAWMTPFLSTLEGYPALAQEYAGASTEQGLFRIHTLESGEVATRALQVAFPDFGGTIELFGQSWCGNQFGVDANRLSSHGRPSVVLFDMNAMDALQLPFDLPSFLEEYENIKEPAFSAALWEGWSSKRANKKKLPLAPLEVVPFVQPFFLGGEDDAANIAKDKQDLDVHLSITAQIWEKVKDLPEGATVDGLTLG